MDLLVVYFNEGAPDEMSLGGVIFCNRDDLGKSSGDDTFPFFRVWVSHHSMGLPAACLPIGKNGPVVAVQNIINQRESTLFVKE